MTFSRFWSFRRLVACGCLIPVFLGSGVSLLFNHWGLFREVSRGWAGLTARQNGDGIREKLQRVSARLEVFECLMVQSG